MIRLVLVIQVYFLIEDGERISDEEVCYVLGQQLVNSCTQRSDYSFPYCTSFMYFSCISHIPVDDYMYLSLRTCTEQLLVDLLVYRQINVIVLLATARQVAVNGVIS